MNLTVSAESLAAETAWMARLKPGGGFNTLTHTMQVTTLLGGIQLRRTDFDQFRETVVPAIGAGQASIAVDATKLANQLKKVSGRATIGIDDGWLSITVGNKTIRLRGSEAEFPAWPQFESTADSATISVRQLSRVLTSVGHDDTLPMLTGVCFSDGAMVTTDRFRLTQVTYDKSGFNALVPGLALQPFAAGTEVVVVTPGVLADGKTPMVRVFSENRSIITPMLDADFPKWRQLIPDERAVCVLLRRDDLLDAVQAENVTLTIDDGKIQVASTDNDGLEIIQKITVSVIRGELPFTVKFSTKYLTECLRSLASGAVRIGANTSTKPVVIQDVSDEGGDLHLLMPIRDAG